MVNLDDPQTVAAELRRRGLPVHRAGDVIGTDERLHELFGLARLGGWMPDRPPKPRWINRGRLIAAMEEQ